MQWRSVDACMGDNRPPENEGFTKQRCASKRVHCFPMWKRTPRGHKQQLHPKPQPKPCPRPTTLQVGVHANVQGFGPSWACHTSTCPHIQVQDMLNDHAPQEWTPEYGCSALASCAGPRYRTVLTACDSAPRCRRSAPRACSGRPARIVPHFWRGMRRSSSPGVVWPPSLSREPRRCTWRRIGAIAPTKMMRRDEDTEKSEREGFVY